MFDYEQLRPGQEEVIQAVLDGRDTLAVLPTGWGKSAIYQITGVLRPGPTIVVSPLIALQRDQLNALREQDVGGVAMLNSTISSARREQIFTDLLAGTLEFLLLAPEQLARPDVLAQIKQARPSLFVVDEAHCICEWGYDFRPEYRQLDAAIRALGHPPILALTATASPPVRAQIIESLGMRDPEIVVRGFDRPNLRLGVHRADSEISKRRAFLEHVRAVAKPGIVYVATRSDAEDLASWLCTNEISALPYHAGLATADRNAAHDAFMDNQVEVIVATSAFGMGIDKANVRFVDHYHISESIDSYYQEIGRAGRDGAPASATLFYNPDDLGLRRFWASGGGITEEQYSAICRALIRADDGSLPLPQLSEQVELSHSRLLTALHRLGDVGAVSIKDEELVRWDRRYKPELAIERVLTLQEHQRQFEQSRVEMIRSYAEGRICRRHAILSYFGETFTPPCDNCDVCCEQASATVTTEQAQPFPLNSHVEHTRWGRGTVLRYEPEAVVVLFDTVGYKTLALDIVMSSGLLLPLAAA